MTIERKFLVVSDDTQESETAAVFAAMRASIVGAGLVVLRLAQRPGFGHWRGIDDEMRDETREAALLEASELADKLKLRAGITPEIEIEEGDLLTAIQMVVERDKSIKVLVLASGKKRRHPGPLVARLGQGKQIVDRPIAVTVVPGHLTDEELNEMGGMTV